MAGDGTWQGVLHARGLWEGHPVGEVGVGQAPLPTLAPVLSPSGTRQHDVSTIGDRVKVVTCEGRVTDMRKK